MDSPTTHVQWASGGRPPEGGLVAEVSADDNEVLSEEQEVERKVLRVVKSFQLPF